MTATPASDPLSDVLRHVQFRASVFYYVNLWATWAVEAMPARQIASVVLPGVSQVMEFHLVAKGSGWARVEGMPPVPLAAGDIVVFPHGDPHVLCSTLDTRPVLREATWVRTSADEPRPIPIVYQRGALSPVVAAPVHDAETILVCGFLGCKAKLFAPFASALPPLLHLPAERSSPWVAAVIDQAARETNQRRPGGSAVLERLSEMMFVDTLRRYLEQLPEGATGWFAAARDRHVGNALAAIHAKPERAWTVEELGRIAGLSRSALHERFVAVLGQTPGQYLARWRVQVGAELLRETQSPVLSIAQDVGYASEAAFSRAFKRITGLPPAAWRRTAAKPGRDLLAH